MIELVELNSNHETSQKKTRFFLKQKLTGLYLKEATTLVSLRDGGSPFLRSCFALP